MTISKELVNIGVDPEVDASTVSFFLDQVLTYVSLRGEAKRKAEGGEDGGREDAHSVAIRPANTATTSLESTRTHAAVLLVPLGPVSTRMCDVASPIMSTMTEGSNADGGGKDEQDGVRGCHFSSTKLAPAGHHGCHAPRKLAPTELDLGWELPEPQPQARLPMSRPLNRMSTRSRPRVTNLCPRDLGFESPSSPAATLAARSLKCRGGREVERKGEWEGSYRRKPF